MARLEAAASIDKGFNPLISGADRATAIRSVFIDRVEVYGFNPLISGADRATLISLFTDRQVDPEGFNPLISGADRATPTRRFRQGQQIICFNPLISGADRATYLWIVQKSERQVEFQSPH